MTLHMLKCSKRMYADAFIREQDIAQAEYQCFMGPLSAESKIHSQSVAPGV